MEQNLRYLNQFYKTQRLDFERLSKTVFTRPTPAAVESLRLATRRIRAVLWLLRKSSEELRFKGLDRDLRELGQSLGAVRELDVAIQDAKNFALDASPLKPKRRQNQKSINPLLAPKFRSKRTKRLAKVTRALRSTDALKLDPALHLVRDRLSSLSDARIQGDKKLQRFCSVIEKTRYWLEASGKTATRLQGLQDCLGRARDLQTLETLLGRHPRVARRRSSLKARALRLVRPALRATLRTMVPARGLKSNGESRARSGR